MNARWSLYRDIRHRLSKAGLTPDQAAEAARLADLALRERRDECIRAAAKARFSYRAIARLWGLTHSQVRRICAVEPDGVETFHPPPAP